MVDDLLLLILEADDPAAFFLDLLYFVWVWLMVEFKLVLLSRKPVSR